MYSFYPLGKAWKSYKVNECNEEVFAYLKVRMVGTLQQLTAVLPLGGSSPLLPSNLITKPLIPELYLHQPSSSASSSLCAAGMLAGM